ncbi:unnamed protein product [Strongylus vulgaris]|uniref:Metallo-beta-lactamase domain-containing protein n=1 Tax=Strongylus vulgaris TaxID=40348 RepID=A0A3P7IRY0_STRVU|nr:unnamed protein product [Strongylus vulgaris]
MNSVDYILVSNWQSLVALPFYSEKSGFKGVVYSTEPVVQFGRLMMQELISYHERIVCDDVDDRWKDPSLYWYLFSSLVNQKSENCINALHFGTFPSAPTRNPLEWKSFYSEKTMESALSRITTISFNQPVVKTFKNLEGNVVVTACPSGYSIGSSNWMFKTEYERVSDL